ncbi:unnamed protein product, partial [Brenthis ino]
MKPLLVLLLVSTLQIVLKCEDKIFKSYSNQVKIPIQRNIKIINARKFEKLRALESRKANTKKENIENNMYTVFPPISEMRLLGVPDEVLVQEQPFVSRNSRVKKVLPVYKHSIFRKKRSIDNINTATNQTVRKKTVRRKKLITSMKDDTKNSTGKVQKRNNKKRKSKSKPSKREVPFVIKKAKRSRRLNNTKTKISRQAKTRSSHNLKYTSRPKKNISPRFKDAILKKITDLNLKRDGKYPKERKVRNRRLIAARDAMIQDYPYVVSIQKNDEHWCAGAILNPRLVITTANCVWKSRSISRMRVRAGSRYMERGGQVAKIYEVVKHPSWNIRSYPDNDVALLLLDRNIKFSDSVHGVDLPNRAMWPVFEDAWVTSWGAERRDGVFQNVGVTLHVYHARLLDHAKCNNVTQRFGVTVTRNFICLAQTGRRAPCTRDTGAPAVSDGILWGLASWGIRKLCGTERFPAMFSYLGSQSNLDFITNATHYLMSDKRFYPYPDRFPVNVALPKASTAGTI